MAAFLQRRLLVLPALIALPLTGLLSPEATARASAATPAIQDVVVVNAPIGKRGGIMTPYVSCSNPAVDPVVKSTIRNRGSGGTHSYSWTGAFPGYGFPRVPVAWYDVTTKATCNGTSRTRVETVRVRQKTYARTVSGTEWQRIKRGMSPTRVAAIVGYGGTESWQYGGSTYRLYDMMPFWSWSIVEYRSGRVVSKQWDVDHD